MCEVAFRPTTQIAALVQDILLKLHWPGSMGGGSGTQLGGAMGGDTGSWWSLDDGPDSWRPRPAALRDLRIISLRRSLETKTCDVITTENDDVVCCNAFHNTLTFFFFWTNEKCTLGYWRSRFYSQSCCWRPQRWRWQSPPQQTGALQKCSSPTFQLLKWNSVVT